MKLQGGGMDGRAFDVWPDVPPKGLDVEHDGRMLRYGFETSSEGVAVYGFRKDAGPRTRRNGVRAIDVSGLVIGTPLRYFPKKP